MALNINAQYTKFVQFAEQQMQAGNETAIARDGGEVAGGGPLAGHAITATTGDKVAPLTRSQANKDANNIVRNLFRQSIIDMFGGEAGIPDGVREAMKLGDFDQGKPLTARRIFAVKEEVDRIVSRATAFNADIFDKLSHGQFGQLPQDMRDGLAQAVNRFRGIFGANAVPPGAAISHILSPMHIEVDIGALRDAANAQGRNLTADEVVATYASKAFNRLAVNTVGSFVLEKAKARDPDIPLTTKSIGSQFNTAHPELLAEIYACKNPEELAAAFQRHEAEINGFVDLIVRSNAADKVVESKATARLATALGLDARLVAAHVPMDKLRSDAGDLTSMIMKGEAPNCRNPGYDVEAAYDALIDEFVQQRAQAYNAIESLDLPQDVKNYWKSVYIGSRNVPKLTPAQLLEISRSIDVNKFASVFGQGLPMKIAVDMLQNIVKAIVDKTGEVTGNARFFTETGVDDLMPIFDMLIAVAKAKNPALATVIEKARDTFIKPADRYCERTHLSLAAIFIKTISVKGVTVKADRFTSEAKFLAIVEADAEAALAECGVTDAKVRKDVKDVARKLGRDALARATGLQDLSDFLAVSKAEATALAKALNGIAKARSSALNVATTLISMDSHIGKAYLMHNLSMNAVTSDSGKLRFLYDDVLAKARNGKGVAVADSLNKANGIVGEFANGKIAILRAIDEAGFDPAERAAHKLGALRDAGWTDPDVATVAKGLAGNKTMKDAARLFAKALTGDAAQALNDIQMRDVFLTFGKAFILTLKELFKEQAERWSGSIETQQRLMKMMVQLLEKEQPGIMEAFARLVGSGRFGTVQNLLSEGLNEIHARKMDFMVLKEYNLMGPPNGERYRDVMANPDLQYDEAEFQKCQTQDELYNVTSVLLSAFGADFPTSGAFDADNYVASITTGRAVIAKYADGLTQETIPLLAKLVGVLDWRGNAAAKSEEIVEKFVEDMKTWRDIVGGSPVSKGLEEVLQRRMNDYLKDILAGNARATFNTGIFQTFLDDLPRCTYIINGKKVPGRTFQEKMLPFMAAIQNPEKRKVVSVIINQQLFGDYTASVANRIPFSGWKNGMPDEPVDTIPNIRTFASRDIMKTGVFPLFDSGPLEFAIDVSPDESTVTVRAKSAYPLHADVTLPTTTFGKCEVSQEFVIDFTGEEPVIRDLKIGQALE